MKKRKFDESKKIRTVVFRVSFGNYCCCASNMIQVLITAIKLADRGD